jgi:hypothetical protein
VLTLDHGPQSFHENPEIALGKRQLEGYGWFGEPGAAVGTDSFSYQVGTVHRAVIGQSAKELRELQYADQ